MEATASEKPTGSETDESTTEGDENRSARFSGVKNRQPKTYLLWGAFVLSVFLAVISAFSLYFQVGSLIGIWIAPRYQPIFRSGFDLAVLLLASYSALSFANLLGVRE